VWREPTWWRRGQHTPRVEVDAGDRLGRSEIEELRGPYRAIVSRLRPARVHQPADAGRSPGRYSANLSAYRNGLAQRKRHGNRGSGSAEKCFERVAIGARTRRTCGVSHMMEAWPADPRVEVDAGDRLGWSRIEELRGLYQAIVSRLRPARVHQPADAGRWLGRSRSWVLARSIGRDARWIAWERALVVARFGWGGGLVPGRAVPCGSVGVWGVGSLRPHGRTAETP
jgi:hypothetical protein